MIKQFFGSQIELINNIKPGISVLDVGGAAAPVKRANVVIDYLPYEKIGWKLAKGEGEVQFDEKTYVQHDICSRNPWPFSDKQFDYSICSHVLEDIRDPLWVCSEIVRVSKAGYIEIPSRIYESMFGIEARKFTGAAHHRWLIELADGKLQFTHKNFYVHSRAANKQKRVDDPEKLLLKFEWDGNFDYFENWLDSDKAMFEYLLDKKITDNEKWDILRRTGPHCWLVGWLKYFKNSSPGFGKLVESIKNAKK
jgi:hypothetical protein